MINNMIIRRKRRIVSLWIEWNDDDLSESLADTLVRNGARGVVIDTDVDIEDYSFPGIKHEHTVFRVGVEEDYPVWRLLSDVAAFNGVFSVGEIR